MRTSRCQVYTTLGGGLQSRRLSFSILRDLSYSSIDDPVGPQHPPGRDQGSLGHEGSLKDVPPHGEESLADEELRPCQKAGWRRQTAREVMKRSGGREPHQCAPEPGLHRMCPYHSDLA
jgi:hypothetical protein